MAKVGEKRWKMRKRMGKVGENNIGEKRGGSQKGREVCWRIFFFPREG